MNHYRPHPSCIPRVFIQLQPCPTSFLSCYHTRILTVVKVSVHAFALSVKQAIKPNGFGHFAGRAVAGRYISSPRLFCIKLGEHFICVPLPLPLPTPKAEQSSVPTVSFILLRALLYTTPTPLTFHNPLTLNPHLYLFIDHPRDFFATPTLVLASV